MNTDGYLTNAGVLLADQNIYRHNRIFCTRWNGLNKTSLEEASDDDEYSGGLVKLLDSALNFVKKNTKKKWKKEASGRMEMPEYDEIAIREAIVNAIIHRQYTNAGSEVTIDIYDNRIVITSPGPMASGLLINKELENNIPSIRRNPILADIFARMKFMDRRGSGFDKIVNGTNRLFGDNKNHVEFYATETHFSVVIYNANYQNDKVNDKVNGKVNDKVKLSDNAEKILNAIINKPSITRKELEQVIGKKESTVNRAIRELKDQGYIDEKDSDKNGEWKILKH
ncbi:MAG: winged helix-turn-helix transcriptional regulator [Bacilli bacterium]|nr:winged helix-turn-helix transcriptional regulator [Bacilli bacterium]